MSMAPEIRPPMPYKTQPTDVYIQGKRIVTTENFGNGTKYLYTDDGDVYVYRNGEILHEKQIYKCPTGFMSGGKGNMGYITYMNNTPLKESKPRLDSIIDLRLPNTDKGE